MSPVTPEALEAIERYALAHRALLALRDREHAVVIRFYGFYRDEPMAMNEVADDLEMSYQATQNTHTKAIRAMRVALGVTKKGLRG